MVAKCSQMSSFDNIYQKMVPSLDSGALAQLHQPEPPPEQNQIGRDVAHELNNILTIIQGYADRMIMKHGQDPTLCPDLKLISNNARRAVAVIRDARKLAAAKALS